MEDLTFEFDWSVEGFSTFKDSNDAKSSPTFKGPTSQYAWQLEMIPRTKADGDETVGVGLFLHQTEALPKTHKLMASFQLSLRDREGRIGKKFGGRNDSKDFRHNWGFHNFLPLSTWNATDCSWLKDDTLRVNCILWIDAEVPLRANMGQCLEDFGRLMLEAGDLFADVAIVTDTKTFMAHKAILSARSKVFAAMFTIPMTEEKSGAVEIKDFDEDTVKGMLEYVYTGQVVNLKDNARSLLQIADKYDLQGLNVMAEDCVVKFLTVDNVTDALVLADLVIAPFLKCKTIEFIGRNKQEVTKTPAFQRLGEINPTAGILMELYLASE